MSQAIHISELLTLIEANAHAARVTGANATLAAASMDLAAGKAQEAHGQAMGALRQFCMAFIQATNPPTDATNNGRLKLAG